MLDLLLFILLLAGFLIGLRRGFILQLIHMIGFIISFFLAYRYYEQLAPKLVLWVPYPAFDTDSQLNLIAESVNLEDSYYRIIAFAIIFFAAKIVMQLIGSMFDSVAQFPMLRPLNIVGGGLMGFIEMYIVLFVLIYIAAMIPMGMIQNTLADSWIAAFILEHTPVFSEQVKDWWLETRSSSS
ncbi:CvpA family protein [Jeotgalibacillus haloalkalitolerans]|uniref:CvpA family protein n=1 Tax=Jeotgalibacillus haloalkalitolerans TaxID=3104292 RepID=A0ABU5KME4_9BACL|nr:CvpA family protein [Jeotgalibacillus sp. HH7-29]MDZ5712413.1 CvpA family protein [Jeotgalibacillus sp. HH7-29]